MQRDHVGSLQQLAEAHRRAHFRAPAHAPHRGTPPACPSPRPDPTPATRSSRIPQSPASARALHAIPPTTYSTLPRCSCVLASNVRRISRMISPIASSATDREFECGSLNTAIPRSLDAARSILSTPMQNAPTETSSGRRIQHRRRDARLRTHSQNRSPAHLLDQFAFFQRPLQRLDLEPRLLKLRSRHPADVLQQQNLQRPSVNVSCVAVQDNEGGAFVASSEVRRLLPRRHPEPRRSSAAGGISGATASFQAGFSCTEIPRSA